MLARPLRVAILEDDDMSRFATSSFLWRDDRTTIAFVAGKVKAMLETLRHGVMLPDIILFDTNHKDCLTPPQVVAHICNLKLNIPVVCVSEYADRSPEHVQALLEAGASGVLDKDDVKYAYATALLQAYATGFVYSPAVEQIVEEMMPEIVRANKHRIEMWRLHPEIKPHMVHMVYQCVLHRMKNKQAAKELLTEKGQPRYKLDTVNKYLARIYEVLLDEDGFYDRTYLPESYFERYIKVKPIKDRDGNVIEYKDSITLDGAFHMVTQPPLRNHPFFSQPVMMPSEVGLYDEDSFGCTLAVC